MWHWKEYVNKTRQKNWDRWNTQAEWETKSKAQSRSIRLNYKSTETIKRCYHIAWSVKRIQQIQN